MGHGHSHGHAHGADGRARNKRALALALALTASFTVAEVVGGILTGSLALLADAGHMLSDAASLAVALFAVWLAERPATAKRTFGFKRAEILAALANGVTLALIAAWILYEANERFRDPPEVLGAPMIVVATIGLVVNVLAFRILSGGESESLNMQAAIRHVLADLAGSVGVIVAAVIILVTGWEYADPAVSVVIALLIAGSAWGVLRDSVRVLLEAAPPGIDPGEVGGRMAAAPGVVEVHDLHIWTITSGFPALSAHVRVGADEDCHRRRAELDELLESEFGIEHTTLQVEHDAEQALIQVEVPRPPEPRA